MFRIMVKVGKEWKMGIVEYPAMAKAEARVKVMAKVGHKCKIVSNKDVFSPTAKANWAMGIVG